MCKLKNSCIGQTGHSFLRCKAMWFVNNSQLCINSQQDRLQIWTLIHHSTHPTKPATRPTNNNKNIYNSTYHGLKRVLLIAFLGFLEDGFKQQCVFCQPLHWPHQNVNQPQAVAVLLRFAPLHRSDIGYLFKVHYGSMGCWVFKLVKNSNFQKFYFLKLCPILQNTLGIIFGIYSVLA